MQSIQGRLCITGEDGQVCIFYWINCSPKVSLLNLMTLNYLIYTTLQNNPRMLTKHKYISHKEVRCEECDKSYSRAVYIRHMRTVHVDKSNRTFKCDLCPYTSHAARYEFVSQCTKSWTTASGQNCLFATLRYMLILIKRVFF